jgi:ABC-type polysaccharide transport system permease subunit
MTKIKKTLLYIRRTFPLYLMMLPGALYLLINNYFPLSGLVVAFKDYDYGGVPGRGCRTLSSCLKIPRHG